VTCSGAFADVKAEDKDGNEEPVPGTEDGSADCNAVKGGVNDPKSSIGSVDVATIDGETVCEPKPDNGA
jgi:hypothetical protein